MTDAPPGLVVANGLGLHTRQGPVFADLDFSFEPGRLAVVSGPSGSGRSALLLAIGGRMRGLTGSMRVTGFDVARQSRQVRARVSLARIAGLADVEGQLSVADSLTERSLIDAVPTRQGAAAFARSEEILGHRFDRDVLVDELPALERALLTVALATLRPAQVILLDDADRSLGLPHQQRLLAALVALTESGATVVASTLESPALPASAQSLALPHPYRKG